MSSKLTDAFSNVFLSQSENGSEHLLNASYTLPDGSIRECVPFPLDFVLGNINGHFTWGFKSFSKSARNVVLEGTYLIADLQSEDGDWLQDHIDLNTRFTFEEEIREGHQAKALKALEVPIVLQLDNVNINLPRHQDQQGARSDALHEKADSVITEELLTAPPAQFDSLMIGQIPMADKGMLNITPNFDLIVETPHGDEAKIGYAIVRANQKTDQIIDGIVDVSHTTLSAEASVSLFHTEGTKGAPISHHKVDILEAGVEASAESIDVAGMKIGKYVEVGAHVNLVKMEAAGFGLNLGAGVDTNLGIKDTSIEAHLAGCGVTLGTTIGISVFGSGFSFDFKKAFWD